uniref:SOCS box domain-containing protein n=1 Tax=Steinernema glaseri TaxID=37863 RepID=A0A1I7ZKA4_9BILA
MFNWFIRNAPEGSILAESILRTLRYLLRAGYQQMHEGYRVFFHGILPWDPPTTRALELYRDCLYILYPDGGEDIFNYLWNIQLSVEFRSL